MENGTKVFIRDKTKQEIKSSRMTAVGCGLLLIVLAPGAYWAYRSTGEDIGGIVGILTIVFGILMVWRLLSGGFRFIVNSWKKTTLSLRINDSGIAYATIQRTWGDIGSAKFDGSALRLYKESDPEQIWLLIPDINRFDAIDEILELVSAKMGKPVVGEKPPNPV